MMNMIRLAMMVPVLSLSATPWNYNIEDTRVYDEADLLSEEEEAELDECIDKWVESGKLDIAVVTTDDNDGKDSETYAADFFENNELGYESAVGSGVILLIDMDAREVAVVTSGVTRVYLDEKIDYILDHVQPELTDKDYFDAAMWFVEYVGERALDARNDSEYEEAFEAWSDVNSWNEDEVEKFYKDYGLEEKSLFSYLQNPLISGIIAVALAAIIVLIMSLSSKTKNTVNAKTYLGNNSMKLNKVIDRYTHTTTHRVKIESNNGSSGGGVKSSSGRSFGGGSRGF